MALLFTVLLSAAVLCLAYFLYDFGREGYERESEATINAVIANVLFELQLNSGQNVDQIIDRRSKEQDGVHFLLADIDGNRLAGDLTGFPADVDLITEGVIRFKVEQDVMGQVLDVQVAAKIHTFDNGNQLLVARDIDEIARRFARLRLLSLMSIVCMSLVIIVSYLISLFVVSRINRMSDTALEIIQTGDLSRRLVIDSRWDDLSHLSGVLNQMLERIEKLMDGVKQVSDNIAHDLRTPLTRLRNQLESVVQNRAKAKDVGELIEEADNILQTFQSLLRISRMDAGQERVSFEELDIQKVFQDVVELYHPLAEEKSIDLQVAGQPGCMVHGDRNLLFQAFANVLDNALKYSEPGGCIRARLQQSADNQVVIAVEDQGPGIPDAEKERVFDRFYRCDASRSSRGSGLGLSLVASIIRLHSGSVSLDDCEPNGLLVQLKLPELDTNITNS
jgi:signal transduction histidine kinase